MSVIKEFREFIARGNVVDLAVGIIIGASFNAIVKSFVDQVMMPPIGWATGGLDFSKLQVMLPDNPTTPAVEAVPVMYGAFINTIVQFLITAFAVFILVKLVNAARRKQEAAPAGEAASAPTPTESLLGEIRDLLKAPSAAPAKSATPVAAPAKPSKVAATKPAAAKATPKAPAKPAPKPRK